MCNCAADSIWSGIAHHGEVAAKLNTSPQKPTLDDLLTLKVKAGAQEGGKYIWSFDLSLLETREGRFNRMVTSTLLAEQASAKMAESNPKVLGSADPFQVKIFQVTESEERTQKDEGGKEWQVREVKFTVGVAANNSESVSIERVLEQSLWVPSSTLCWYVDYACIHDKCHMWPCNKHNCNYRCGSRVCSVNSSADCGPWKTYSPFCSPACV